MEVFRWLPIGNPTCSINQRVLKAQFGDGYISSMPDGINTETQSWSLEFAGSSIDEINQFLLKHGGYKPFKWTTPDGFTGYFKSNGLSSKYYGNRVKSISVTFDQDFRP